MTILGCGAEMKALMNVSNEDVQVIEDALAERMGLGISRADAQKQAVDEAIAMVREERAAVMDAIAQKIAKTSEPKKPGKPAIEKAKPAEDKGAVTKEDVASVLGEKPAKDSAEKPEPTFIRKPIDQTDTPAFSRAEPEANPTLIIQHNLTADNLLHALKMGGIPVPSLAITDKAHPLESFGDITLLGSKSMADPKGYADTKVFGADIYSPRYPRVNLQFTPAMKKQAEAKFAEGMKATDESYMDWSNVSDDGVRAIEQFTPVLWTFLKSKGIDPKIVRTEPTPLPPALQPFAGDTRFSHELAGDPAFIEAAWASYEADLTKAYGDAAEAAQEIAASRKRAEERGSSQVVMADARKIEAYQRDLRDSGRVDRSMTRRALDDQVREAGLQEELTQYATDTLAEIAPDERIFQGFTNSGNRRYKPHTLDNVINILKKELRGGESFNYGVGSLRAKFTPQFKSIAQIQGAKGRLMDAKSFDKVKDEISNELVKVAEAFNHGSLDTTISMLEEAPKLGIERAAKQYNKDIVVTDSMRDAAAVFLARLKNLPTAYFEAKILRGVDLAEFSGAVVPEGTSQKVLDAMASRGITNIKTYGKDEGSRAKAIESLADELHAKDGNILFSRDTLPAIPAPTPFATKLEANMAAMKQSARIIQDDNGRWLLAPKPRAYNAKELQDAQQRVDTLNQALRDGNHNVAPAQALSDTPTQSMAWGGRVAEILGYKVTFIARNRSFDGVALGRNAFISPSAKHPEIGLIGHEVLHVFRRTNPGLYDNLLDQIRPYLKNGVVDAARMREDANGGQNTSEAHAEEEVIADLHGSMWVDPQFWREMAQNDPSLFRKVAYKFMEVAARVVKALGRFDASNLVSDVDAVRTIIAQEWAAQAQDVGNESGGGFVGAAFSRSADKTQTDNFKRWFGDSKVVDSEGNPLVVYHGTPSASFDVFKPEQYFAEKGDIASIYTSTSASSIASSAKSGDAPAVYPVYLKIEKPFDTRIPKNRRIFEREFFNKYGTGTPLSEKGLPDWNDARDLADWINEEGKNFDGIILDEGGIPQDDGTIKSRGISYVALRGGSQVKSATGNNGDFSLTNPNINFSRATPQQPAQPTQTPRTKAQGYTPSGRRTISKVVADVMPGLGLDMTGRVQLEVGEKLYNFIADKTGPWWERAGMRSASPELVRQIRKMKLVVAKAQETAVEVARETQKFSEQEREMVSDIIERELATGVLPPNHAIQMAQTISATMDQQTDELVRLKMLSKDAADKWRGQYLPRFYKSKMADLVPDAWADALRGLSGKTRAMKGIKGNHLKRRGMTLVVAEDQLANYTALGWEVDDSSYTPSLNGDEQVPIWRDFTKDERESMGEIRDASFRFVMGYMQTQKDIALGTMFEGMAKSPTISSQYEQEGFDVMVPDTTVQGTGTKRYGMMAGRYVSRATMSHLSQIEESQSDALRLYREALGVWKESKTVLNPVSHMNNVVSNLTMAHLAGVSYYEGDKYMAAALDFAKGSPKLQQAKEAGLFLGTVSDVELMNTLPKELRDLAVKEESYGRKIGRTAFDIASFYLRRPMGAAYQGEDLFFRYLIWKDATDRGLDAQDAVDYAQKFIFTYDDLPSTARKIRDFGIPFFSYTYKFIPAALSTAMTHPWRMAAPAAVMWAAQAAMYAMLASGDDDDWADVLKRYMTDAGFRDKVSEKQASEQKNLPSWQQGRTALGTPRTMRLGKDEATGFPLFIDVSRLVPGGDIFDVAPNAGGVPFFQWMTPSHPIFTTAVAMFGNKDLFLGKEIVDKNDDRGEATEKRLAWLWKQASPAIAVNNYHWQRGMNAMAFANGGELPAWVPDMIGGDSTGIGRDRLPVQPHLAALQTIGIKVRPQDLDKSEQMTQRSKEALLKDIDRELTFLRRLNRDGVLGDRGFDRELERANVKKDRIRDGLTVDGDKR